MNDSIECVFRFIVKRIRDHDNQMIDNTVSIMAQIKLNRKTQADVMNKI